jgi:membrane protein
MGKNLRINAAAIAALFKQTFLEWFDDNVQRLGAALAYYTIFSLAPLLIIVIAIAGLGFGQQTAQSEILAQLRSLLGDEGAKATQAMIENAQRPATGLLATLIGIVMLLIGATGVFGQLQEALNTIWGVMPKPGWGIKRMIKDRFLSFVMVLGIGFLLLVSLVLSAGLAALGKFFNYLLPVPEGVLQLLNFLVSFGVITLLFAMIYKVLPDVKIGWSDVWIGAAMTALLFTLGKSLIGLYLGKSGVASAYGAAGSLVIILLWVYYSSQILLFGAEFTFVYANKYGGRIVPADNAMLINKEIRAEAEQGIPAAAEVKVKVPPRSAARVEKPPGTMKST